MKLAAAFMAACLAGSAAWGQTAQAVPDEIAYRILFQLMRPHKEGAWDAKTQVLWLEKRGFPPRYFYPLQSAAHRYWNDIAPYEADLRAIHARFAGRNDSPEAVAAARPARDKISEQLRLTVRDLESRLDSEGVLHLRRRIEEIKKETRRTGAPAGPAGGGGHAY